MLNLCGFTYGINGFLVAAFASLVASAVVFIVLRYLFGEDLRSWSERNETWNAVEAVVVSYHILPSLAMVLLMSSRMPRDSRSSFSLEYLLSHHGHIQTLSLR
jgi:uncharacterized membrane protein YdjX (TVP38/TMEM64 family)